MPGDRRERLGQEHAGAGHALPGAVPADAQGRPQAAAPTTTCSATARSNDVILVDQSPIGRSPRSNPVTYIKAFDEIRAVFAETVEARTHNYDGQPFQLQRRRRPLHRLPGRRLHRDRHAVSGRRLHEVPPVRRPPLPAGNSRQSSIAAATSPKCWSMTVREAFTFFRGQPKVQARLKRLIDVGLDYLRLGQPANTLSGGEAQRLKLAGYMSATRNAAARCSFSTSRRPGLHFHDIVQLLDCFDALLAVGHSLIVVEHNLQMMKAADYIIDLGPGAADEGGRIVAQGTPEWFRARKRPPPGDSSPRPSREKPKFKKPAPNLPPSPFSRGAHARRIEMSPPLDHLELFFGAASSAEARFYARYELGDSASDRTSLEITGQLIGPVCDFSQTLPGKHRFIEIGAGLDSQRAALVQAIVPDPCFWTPELPFLYRAELQIDCGGDVVEARRTVGIRRLGVRGKSLFFDGKRFVLRGRREFTMQNEACRMFLRNQDFLRRQLDRNDGAESWRRRLRVCQPARSSAGRRLDRGRRNADLFAAPCFAVAGGWVRNLAARGGDFRGPNRRNSKLAARAACSG